MFSFLKRLFGRKKKPQPQVPFFGFDFLALGNYTERDLAAIVFLPKNIWFGCFFTGFRLPIAQMRFLLRQGFRNWRVHLVWDDKHRVNKDRMRQALEGFEIIKPYLPSHTIISLHCEPNFDPLKEYAEFLHVLKDFRVLRREEEVHHEFRRSKIFSHDGEGIENQTADKNLRYLKQTDEIFFFWHNAFNYFTKDITIRPYDRIHSVWDDYFHKWLRALGDLIARYPTKDAMLPVFEQQAYHVGRLRFIPCVFHEGRWQSKINDRFVRLTSFREQLIEGCKIHPCLPV